MSKKNRLRRQETADTSNPAPGSSSSGIFRFPPLPFFVVLLAWFGLVYKNYLPSHPAVGSMLTSGIFGFSFAGALAGFIGVLPDNAVSLLFLSMVLILSYGLGRGLLSLFGVTIPSVQRGIFAVGLGFAAIAYLMLLLGAVGALHKHLIYTVFFIGCAVSAFRIKIWTFRAGSLKSGIDEISQLGAAWKFLVVLGVLFLFLNIVMAFTPEVFYDSLVYHLAAPGYYLQQHQILPMRFLSHSNFPLNLSMIYMLALSLNNEMLAKMIHCSMGLLTVLLIYSSIKRLYNVKTAVFSVLIFCSTPIFAMNSWTCGNDVGVTFFFALAFVAYLDWLKTGEAGHFALFSVFTGISAGMKYTAAFWVTGLAVSLVIYLWRNHRPVTAAKKLVLYFSIVFLFALPWLIKNYVFTRNPVQPFFHTIFGGENLKIVGGGGGNIINSPLNVFSFKFADFLASPWTLTMKGGDSLTYLGPVFLLLLPCLLLFRKMDRLIKYSLVVFCAGYAVWYLGTPAYRYMLPLFVALSVCLGWAAYFVSERFKLFKFLVLIILSVNFIGVFAMGIGMGLDGFFAKGTAKEEFLSVSQPSYPNPPYAAIQWINKNLPPEAKVFFIGESRPFYMQRDFLSYSIENNMQPLMAYLRKANDSDEFYAILRGEKFTHLLINYREALRNNASYREFDWTSREREIFYGFWKKYVRQEYFKEGVYVYGILPAESKTPTPPNMLDELETEGWKNGSLMKVYTANKMWAGLLEEFEMYARYGADVRKEIETCKMLMAKDDIRRENGFK